MYRDLGDIDTALIRAVFKLGAAEGVPNITSRKVAALCDISVGTVFNKYPTMRELLDAAAQAFDRPHMEKTAAMAAESLTAEQIWDRMLSYFLSDPEGTLYYVSYTSTFGFDPTTENPRAEEFLRIAKVFFRSPKTLSDNQYLVLWDYVTSMAFYYAEKLIHRLMPCDAEMLAFVKQIVFGGVAKVLEK